MEDTAAIRASAIVEEDLDYICRYLEQEFRELSGCRLLITGGAGFLGYYLAQSVLRWNDTIGRSSAPIDVVICDNYWRGRPSWCESLSARRDVTLFEHDVRRPLPQTLPAYHYIMHAASIASPTYYRRWPLETMDANVCGLRSVLEYARRQQHSGAAVRAVLFFSSSEIYGDPTPENIPTPETYRGHVSCTGPRACYDEAKRYGETLCVMFARHAGVPAKIVRPFSNYGPGLKITDRRVIPDFARAVLNNRDIVVYSDGSPRRTFCYAADAVVGYFKVLVRGQVAEPYNIGVDEPEVTIRELAHLVASQAGDLFGYCGQVVGGRSSDNQYLVDDPARRCPVIDKASRELGFNPRTPLSDGIRRSLIWYAEHCTGTEA